MHRPDSTRRPALLLLVGLIALSACQTTPPPPEVTRESLQQALHEHRYREALTMLDTRLLQDPDQPELSQQREDIIKASREYREQTLAEAQRLAGQEQWRDAQGLLESTGGHLIHPGPLVALRESLHQQEAQRLRQRLSEWWQAQARALLDSATLDSTLTGYTLPEAGQTLELRQALKADLSERLTEVGNTYAEQGDWSRAQRALHLAHQLQPDQPAPEALGQAQQVLARARQRAEQQQTQRQRERSESLMAAYRESGSLKDLLAIREYLRSAPNNHLTALRDEVETLCRERYTKDMATGDALYARGEYQAAYAIWQELKPLAPDNVELNKKLERTRRVLNNLRALDATSSE
ncbi:hypothetical protein [Alloalcanivorax xenomutans]|uniref:hypothetical protein n=1 Tax=Alloalcanivorax xenomutans TaxID=1094342 RepID=UPI0006883029